MNHNLFRQRHLLQAIGRTIRLLLVAFLLASAIGASAGESPFRSADPLIAPTLASDLIATPAQRSPVNDRLSSLLPWAPPPGAILPIPAGVKLRTLPDPPSLFFPAGTFPPPSRPRPPPCV